MNISVITPIMAKEEKISKKSVQAVKDWHINQIRRLSLRGGRGLAADVSRHEEIIAGLSKTIEKM